MTDESPAVTAVPKRKWPKRLLMVFVVAVIAGAFYIRTHPLVFNESFWGHAHCIPQAGLALRIYATDHDGRFPYHTNGYGDALLVLLKEDYCHSMALTGPGYDQVVFDRARTNYTDVLEAECGRVYIQGLSEMNNSGLAILFDKLATPGGDHCHGFRRLTAPLCREVSMIDGSHQTILESKWQEFAANQIELLVKEGFDRATAEDLYAEKGKSP